MIAADQDVVRLDHVESQRIAGRTGGGPRCFCGSRDTRRIGASALMRQCQGCGKTMAWRLERGEFKAFPLHVAVAIDKRRAK